MSFEMPPTPEHDKLTARKDEHEAVVHFLNWLDGGGYQILNSDHPHGFRFSELVAEYFEVDSKAYEAENRAILDAIRKADS